MSATPPEAKTEYSRGGLGSEGPGGASSAPAGDRRPRLAVLAGGVAGAVLLIICELTPLFTVRTSAHSSSVKSVTTGSHHSYALIPLALLAGLLAYAVFRYASRPALPALGALGVIALLIALIGDLPDAQANGLVGSTTQGFIQASSRPAVGLYLETLG